MLQSGVPSSQVCLILTYADNAICCYMSCLRHVVPHVHPGQVHYSCSCYLVFIAIYDLSA